MEETTLDVEWAHAIAPKAKIVLVIAPTPNNDDLAAAITTGIAKGNVISNSYGEPESDNAPADFKPFETALKLAALRGVAVNFSSGDDGDFVLAQGYSDVSYPASSTFATAVGGNSVILNYSQKIKFQTGWGTNLTAIASTDATGNPPYVPPVAEGFLYGAGGGTSKAFSKPSFQSKLSGSRRLVPDIGWVADPYTGVEFIYTDPTLNEQVVGVIGGTSVAAPMFSGLWAVAAQKHGGPLGQAARRLYSLPAAAITDVKALEYGENVSGVVKDSGGSLTESARALATPTAQIKTFTSAFYHSPNSTRWFVITFGTDSSLPTKDGWDPVTGLGTPNGVPFVTDAAK
jgi:subtilase family serine protease